MTSLMKEESVVVTGVGSSKTAQYLRGLIGKFTGRQEKDFLQTASQALLRLYLEDVMEIWPISRA